MTAYRIVHTVNSSNADKKNIKSSAARALYIELLKYYNTKTAAEKSA